MGTSMEKFTLDESDEGALVGNVLKTVDKYGLCILPRFVKDGDLITLNEEFDKVLSEDSASGVYKMDLNVGRGANVHQYELGEAFPEMRDFFRSEWMQNASDEYWGGPAKLNDNIYVMEEVPGTEHVAQDLHFDVLKTFKFFLYLNDVTVENGAFSCVPGSHKHTEKLREELGDEISYEKRELTRDHPFSEEEVVPIEGEAGTLIVFTTEVWHRAGKVSRGERRVMRGHTRLEQQPEVPPRKKVASKKRPKKEAPEKRGVVRRLLRSVSRRLGR